MNILGWDVISRMEKGVLHAHCIAEGIPFKKTFGIDRLRQIVNEAERSSAPAQPSQAATPPEPRPTTPAQGDVVLDGAIAKQIALARESAKMRLEMPITDAQGKQPIGQKELIEFYAARDGNRKGRILVDKLTGVRKWYEDIKLGVYNNDPEGYHYWFSKNKRLKQDVRLGNEPVTDNGEYVIYGDSADYLLRIPTKLHLKKQKQAELEHARRSATRDIEEESEIVVGRALEMGTAQGLEALMQTAGASG